jgi:tetratricopeptide (TPR) repeat protein
MGLPRCTYSIFVTFLLGACCLFGVHLSGAHASDWSECSSGDPARAVSGCSIILNKGNATPPAQRAVALVNRGIAFYDRNELEKARADYTSAIQLDPKNAEAFHNRGDLLLRQGVLEAAIKDYTDAIAINDRLASAYNGRGNALRESGQIDRAIVDYSKAIDLDPKSPFAYSGRGNALRDKGELDKAIADYSRAIEINSGYATAYIGRANALTDKSDWSAALKDYDAAIAIDPKDPTGYNNRGTAYQNNRELDKAIADYDKAILLDSKRAAFHFNRALALHLKDNIDGAFADYSETIKLDPSYAFAYHNRGLISQRKGDLDRAIADYTKAIEINPKYPQNFTSRGLALLQKNDVRKAIEDLQNSIRMDDRQTSAIIGLGDAYAKSQSFGQAKAMFDQAIQLDPVSSEAYFKRGRLLEANGDWAQASSDYKIALSFDPQLKGAQEALKKAADRAKAAKVESPVTPSGRLNRVALVIGNSDYARVPSLPNALHDASTIAEAFQKIGFRQVIKIENQGRDGMLAALRSFRDLADNSEWAVIYYAGHGIEIDGTNYIVPTDARLVADRDVQDETISLSRFLDAIERAKEIKLVILDACRENPFLNSMKMSTASRSIGRGLARIEPEGGTLVAYSAKHGQIALDGKGENSPFATALANRMLTPDIEIRKLFGLVRDDVLAATSRKQEPFIYGTLGGDDHFINPKQ